MEALLRDVECALRIFRRSPAFTITALAALAIGIGANTAVFSVVNTVLLRPVSAPDPDRVVEFLDTFKSGPPGPLAADIEFNLWREHTGVFQDISGYTFRASALTAAGQPQRVNAMSVTTDYFRLFGLPVAQGRTFTEEEERPNGGQSVVLSDSLWKRAFGGDSQIIGKTILLDGNRPYRVIGIMAQGVETETPEPPDIWLPFPIDPNSSRQVHYFRAVGRLKPGVTLDMAKARLQLTTQEFRRRYPTVLFTSRGESFSVQPIRDFLVSDVRTSLLILAGAVGLVLLIACANVANLLLIRATGRRREIAIRLALGATRSGIVRQLLTESVLLSMLGAVIGLALGLSGIHALLAMSPTAIPRIGADARNVAVDWRVLLFTVLVALTTGLLFGLIPAFQASRASLTSNLKEGGAGAGSSYRQSMVRSLLVVGEVSLALSLLIGAGLLIRTLLALRSVNPGFDFHDVVTTRAPLGPQFGMDVLRRLNALPGVESAALTNLLPLDGSFNSLPLIVVGRPLDGPSHGASRKLNISPSYFDVLKIPLIRGRLFTDSDRLGAPGVAIVNQTLARQLWPGGDPIGSQVFIGKGLGPNIEEPARQIVGIVGDVHDDALNLNPAPAIFTPAAQPPNPRVAVDSVTWVIRTRWPSAPVDLAIQDEIRRATGGLPVRPLRSMEQVMARSTARQDFNMLLMTVFGASALLLAAIGIYGLMAYSVQHRTQEMGVRLALGASPGDVRNMIVFQGMRLALAGIVIGAAAALGLARLIAGFLFGVTASDPEVFILAPILLCAVALFAVWVPARRASRVDPIRALRYE